MAYLYVFIDESGNYDFSPTGTRHWVLTSAMTDDVHPGVVDLYDLKHKLIDQGTNLEYFHAAEDRQAVRDEVFGIIKQLTNGGQHQNRETPTLASPADCTDFSRRK